MIRNKDLRLKLTEQAHRLLLQVSQSSDLTMQAYVERLIASHLREKLAQARALVEVAGEETVETPSTRIQRWVYFVQRGHGGAIKIGSADNVAARIRALQTGSDCQLTLLHECLEAPGLTERALHTKFKHLRLAGEWFKGEPALLAFIDSLQADHGGIELGGGSA